MAKRLMYSFFSLVLLIPLIKANEVKLEISSPTQSGSWAKFHDVLLHFSIDGKHFMLGQRENDKTSIIQELLPNGKLTTATDHQSMHLIFFTYQFVYSVDGYHFIYGQNKDNKRWYTERLISGGKFGSLREGSPWGRFYDNPVPFSIDGRQFFYAQSESDKRWFIQELLSNGFMGEEVSSGHWSTFYQCQLSFTINNRVFLYGQSWSTRFFVQELLPGGVMGKETDSSHWFYYYVYQFPISVNGSHYLYTKAFHTGDVHLRTLLPGGTVGNAVYSGTSKLHHLFGYNIGTRTFLFAHASKDEYTEWAIQEVLPGVHRAASETKDDHSERRLGDSNLTSTVAPEIESSSTHTP